MNHYSTTFFQYKSENCPQLTIRKPEKDDKWTNTIEIHGGQSFYSAQVTIHLLTESDLYKFCNSVISELRRYRKEQGYDR